MDRGRKGSGELLRQTPWRGWVWCRARAMLRCWAARAEGGFQGSGPGWRCVVVNGWAMDAQCSGGDKKRKARGDAGFRCTGAVGVAGRRKCGGGSDMGGGRARRASLVPEWLSEDGSSWAGRERPWCGIGAHAQVDGGVQASLRRLAVWQPSAVQGAMCRRRVSRQGVVQEPRHARSPRVDSAAGVGRGRSVSRLTGRDYHLDRHLCSDEERQVTPKPAAVL